MRGWCTLRLMGEPGRARVVVRRAGAGFRWALVTGNGRVVAVSGAEYADQQRAVLACESQLKTDRAALTVTVKHGANSRGWMWHAVTRSGELVAASPVSYERHGTCVRAAQRFLTITISHEP